MGLKRVYKAVFFLLVPLVHEIAGNVSVVTVLALFGLLSALFLKTFLELLVTPSQQTTHFWHSPINLSFSCSFNCEL